MDKNTLTGLFLIGLVLIAYQYYLSTTLPPPEEVTTSQTEQQLSSEGESESAVVPGSTDGQAAANSFSQPDQEETFTSIENDVLKLKFSNKGGRLYHAELKNFSKAGEDSGLVTVVDGPQNQWNYHFFTGAGEINTQQAYFKAEKRGAKSVAFVLETAPGQSIEQVYSLKDGEYLLDYDFNMRGFQDQFTNSNRIEFKWENDLLPQEKRIQNERMNSTVYYKEKNDDPSYLSMNSDSEIRLGKTKWVSSKQQFFTNALIAADAFDSAEVELEQPSDADNPDLVATTSARLSFEHNRQADFRFPMQMYIGPTEYKRLKSYGLGMEEQVNLGYAIFAPFSKYLVLPIFKFFEKYVSNYGIVILLMTLFIKMLLMPLTYRSYKSMAKMGALKPEINALKEKYGDDPQKMQQEQLKLWGQAGVNPLGGCLPQLLQMPILISMYYIFPAMIELRQQPFLWADDLSTYDSIMNLPFHIPMYGSHVSLFTLLSGVSSVIFFRLNSQMNSMGNDNAAQMKIFQWFMPLMLVFIFNSFSAALTWYFFLSNVISGLQQIVIKKFFIDEEQIRANLLEAKKKPKKISKWQQRIKDMQKMQEEMAKQQQQDKSGRRRK